MYQLEFWHLAQSTLYKLKGYFLLRKLASNPNIEPNENILLLFLVLPTFENIKLNNIITHKIIQIQIRNIIVIIFNNFHLLLLGKLGRGDV